MQNQEMKSLKPLLLIPCDEVVEELSKKQEEEKKKEEEYDVRRGEGDVVAICYTTDGDGGVMTKSGSSGLEPWAQQPQSSEHAKRDRLDTGYNYGRFNPKTYRPDMPSQPPLFSNPVVYLYVFRISLFNTPFTTGKARHSTTQEEPQKLHTAASTGVASGEGK